MDKKTYAAPTISIITINSNDVITASGLIFGGESGKSKSESFSALFGN